MHNRKTHELVSQAISKVLTTGKVKRIEMEEAFLLPEITQQIYDVMTINLNIDPVYITDRISWHVGASFPDSINLIVKEYKTARNLNPIRIIVLGPPASGKTRVARYLVDHYEIHYIHVKSLIEDTIAELVSMISRGKTNKITKWEREEKYTENIVFSRKYENANFRFIEKCDLIFDSSRRRKSTKRQC